MPPRPSALPPAPAPQAIERVNDLDPEILEEQQGLFFHLQQQRLIELIRQGQLQEALEFAQARAGRRGGGRGCWAGQGAAPACPRSAATHVVWPPASTPAERCCVLPAVAPAWRREALPCLAWVQEYLAPRGEDHPELLEELGAAGLLPGGRLRGWLAAAATAGRRLLPPAAASRILRPPRCSPAPAERTVALLVFEDVRSSPLADLMDVAQRQKTASELNAAILASQSQASRERGEAGGLVGADNRMYFADRLRCW